MASQEERNGRTDGKSPFYRTSSPPGAATQKAITQPEMPICRQKKFDDKVSRETKESMDRKTLTTGSIVEEVEDGGNSNIPEVNKINNNRNSK